jgi:putative ABC transport system permease protein
MLNDIRYGLRQLIKHPAFTIIAILTLALGIGANTAIFSVVNAILLKPLPFPEPDQLIAVGMTDLRAKDQTVLNSLSYPDFFDFRDQNRTLTSIAVYRDRSFALSAEEGATSLRGQKVSGEFFDVLGIKPQIGRAFTRADEQAGGGPAGFTVIISHEFWQQHYGADPNVVGRTITLDRRPYTIAGVMPGGFQFPIQNDPVDLYVTIADDASNPDGSEPQTKNRGSHSLRAVARLKPGATAAQADAD